MIKNTIINRNRKAKRIRYQPAGVVVVPVLLKVYHGR
jgi:hypothetical protein